jgi:hypothetical protein
MSGRYVISIHHFSGEHNLRFGPSEERGRKPRMTRIRTDGKGKELTADENGGEYTTMRTMGMMRITRRRMNLHVERE